jgi:hypothetical protein
MKQTLTLLTACILFAAQNGFSQAKKFVLFEHFTQASCGPCAAQNPAFQDNILAENLGRLHHIAYHTSWPGTDPMYTHNPAESDDRVNYYGVSGVPDMYLDGGVIGSPGNATQQMVDDAISATSAIAVLVSETDNGSNRDVTVEVKTVGTPPTGNLVLRVAVVEKWITYANAPGTNGEKEFPNVFRKMITPMSGDAYTAASQGSSVSFNYNYTEHADWDNSEIYVIAWIQNESTLEVINSGSSLDPHGELVNTGASFMEGSNGSNTSFNGTAGMLLNGSENFMISLSDNAPSDWSATFTIDGNTYSSSATLMIDNAQAEYLTVDVTPGATPAFAIYTLTITSVDNPQTFSQSVQYMVISGVTDLVVNNATAYSDGEEYAWNDLYTGGLEYALNTSHDEMMINHFMVGMDQAALGGVNNIYWNVGWSFPALTVEVAQALKDYLDAGGNLLLAGQDIGWAAYDTQFGYGNSEAQSFFTDYMQVQFLNDGGAGNNQYIAVASDSVFGQVQTSAIADVYTPGSGYLFPDEISIIGNDAKAIFNYTGGVKIGGSRIETNDYKLVYLAAGLEHLDFDVANEIMKLSHDWFYGDLTEGVFDVKLQQLLQSYPNPAAQTTAFEVQLNNDAMLTIIGIHGHEVHRQLIPAGTTMVTLDVSNLPAGTYMYYLHDDSQLVGSNKLEVIR